MSAEEGQHVGYVGNYLLRRPGEDSAVLAEVLASPPARPLDEAEKQVARQFEHDMLCHVVETGITLEDVLKLKMDETTVAPIFFC